MNTPAPLSPNAPQREQAIERLTRSFADDAITMDEFERRAELVYRAVTVAELQQLTADLPAVVEPTSTKGGKGVARVVTSDRITTFLGSTERRMPAAMPRQLSVRTVFGNTELDFRGSRFEPGITEVHVRCLFGNVEITVPEGVRVELLVSSVLANVGATRNLDQDDGLAAEAVLRVTGRAIFANVEVHTATSSTDVTLT
ncbi:MAG: DUF1707 domain-containing protein [Gemmatimonas sp.]